MKKITDYLISLGLTKIEATVYQGLLQTGPTTVKELSEFLRMKRITTHFNVESLIIKGLIIQTMHGARRKIIAEKPDYIKDIIKKQLVTTNALMDNFPAIHSQLIEIMAKGKNNKKQVEVTYYEGRNAVFNVYKLTMRADEVFSFVNLDKFYHIFPNTENQFLNALNRNPKRKVWDIALQSHMAEKISKSHARYFCKLIPHNLEFSGFDLIQFLDNLAIIQLEDHNVSATVIKSQAIALSFRALHKSMWGLITD